MSEDDRFLRAIEAAKAARDAEANAKLAERKRADDIALLAALRAKYPDA